MSGLPPIVCIHGALRSRVGMWPTARFLARLGHPTRTFGYRSRRGTLRDHGENLAHFIRDWLGESPPLIGLLTHSMGGLVARAYLGGVEPARLGERQRVVMLSPPNKGSQLAELNRHNRLFRWAYGDAALQLVGGAVEELAPLPATADVLILAGGTGRNGYNPRIEGDDDGVVGLAEMGLPETDPTFVGGYHGLLQWTPSVLRRASAFISSGADPMALDHPA